MRTLLLLPLLAACAGGTDKDSDTSGVGHDTGPAPECNTDNEACAPRTCGGEGQNMLPGSDCISCHSAGSGAGEEDEDAPVWTIAGTAFSDRYGSEKLAGATVRVTDNDGNVIELRTNAVGNFYTRERVAMPFSAEIEVDGNVIQMTDQQEYGGCNSCHACEGEASGKLYGH